MSKPSLDLEASPVPGQQASAVLDLSGNVIEGQMDANATSILYQMLLESAQLPDMDGFRRLTVVVEDTRYVVARDKDHIYIAQTTTSAN